LKHDAFNEMNHMHKRELGETRAPLQIRAIDKVDRTCAKQAQKNTLFLRMPAFFDN
jgi:hypothetical protein